MGPETKSLDELLFELDELYQEREFIGERLDALGARRHGRLGEELRLQMQAVKEQIRAIRDEIRSLGFTDRIPDHPRFSQE